MSEDMAAAAAAEESEEVDDELEEVVEAKLSHKRRRSDELTGTLHFSEPDENGIITVSVHVFPVPKRKRREEDDVFTCMICLDRPANTLVLPCMHSVVCNQCSEELKNTPDHSRCVRCRQQIEEVLQDEA